MKRLGYGQSILNYVKEHKDKNGTPTMGGIFILLSVILTFFIFSGKNKRLAVMALTISIAFLIIGALDDLIKIKFKRNLGLTAIQKSVFLISISILASIYAYKNGLNLIYIPFLNRSVYFGWFSIFINVFVFIATVNGANLTDGLDGLLSGVSTIIFLAFAVIISLELRFYENNYILKQEYQNLSLLSLIFVGALLGYLSYNSNRASVFMGDTGSLALGGAVCSIAIFSGNTFYIPIVAISYVLSVLSVIIQVLHFKRTKKRVFKMAPLHHHFQLSGKSECKISYNYTLLTILLSAISILFLMR